jgi:hypothetical protein
LSAELLHLPSLDEAKSSLGDRSKSSWVASLPSQVPGEGLYNVVETHNRALNALTDRGQRYRHWSVVAPPHDVTGPPKDLKELPSMVGMRQNNRYTANKGLASEWAKGFSSLFFTAKA